ncbi:MAG: hypothetical protein ABIO70_17620, partial [Pseudomonadota bacterium]
HLLGAALLAGAEEAVGPEAAERARGRLDRGLRAARVARLLGHRGACGLREHQLECLAGVDDALLAALGASLRASPLKATSFAALLKRLRKVAEQEGLVVPEAVAVRLGAVTAAQVQKNLARDERDLKELCGPGLRLYVGPVGLSEELGLWAVEALTAAPVPEDRVEADPPEVAASRPRASGATGDRFHRPLIVALRRLAAWCRRLARQLTPCLRERLLLPV